MAFSYLVPAHATLFVLGDTALSVGSILVSMSSCCYPQYSFRLSGQMQVYSCTVIPDLCVSRGGPSTRVGGRLLIVKNVLVNLFYVFSQSVIAVHSEWLGV